MAFADLTGDLSYWQKQTKPLFADLAWNIPEQKTGRLGLIGGSSQGFNFTIRTAEFIDKTFPVRDLSILLPATLRTKLPPLLNLNFAPATDTGSFAQSPLLSDFITENDYTLITGDLSRNSATAIALATALTPADHQAEPPHVLLTRDTIDLLAPNMEQLLANPNLTLFTSSAQLQKVFRAVYYPKMIMLSAPLLPILEAIHKFTLTYPATILTFHEGQLITARDGRVITTPLTDTGYSLISLWSGELAAKIAALNLYNPTKPLESTTAALLYH